MLTKMMFTRFRRVLLIIVYSLILVSIAFAQREIEAEEIKKKPPAPTLRPAVPRGPRLAQKRTNGVLFVLTEPLTANVTIKNSRGEILRCEESDNGELRAELPQGTYGIEVTAAKYFLLSLDKILISPSQPKIVKAYLKPTTGLIIIGLGQVEPGRTTVLIDEQQPSHLNVKMNKKKEKNQIELDEVPEGIHTVTITNPSIVDWKRGNVQVSGGERITIAPRFEPAITQLNVTTEPGAL